MVVRAIVGGIGGGIIGSVIGGGAGGTEYLIPICAVLGAGVGLCCNTGFWTWFTSRPS